MSSSSSPGNPSEHIATTPPKLTVTVMDENAVAVVSAPTTDQGKIAPGYPPGSFRLPTCYSINLQFEKRFHILKRYWALRAGFDNVTNHANDILANGVLDADHPLPTYIDGNGRAFTGRIRFLGKD